MAGVYGLSGSGMDIDSLVKNLMKAQRTRYDSMQQKKTQLEWKKTDYNTMYTSINEFRNTTVWNNKLQSTLMPKKVTSSNETIATVTANADAVNVNHSMTVTQLADGVTKTSSASITATGRAKDTLADQFAGLSGTFDLQINGKKITVDTRESINTLVSTINNSGAGVRANYDTTMDRFFLYSNDTGAAAGIDFSNSSTAGLSFINNNLKLNTLPTIDTATTSTTDTGFGANLNATLSSQLGYSGSFVLKIKNGTDTAMVTVNATDTMQNLLDNINTATDPTTGNSINAVASYDTSTGKFSLRSSSGSLDLSGSDAAGISFFTNQLKIAPKTQGEDARFTLDGASFTQASNSFTISGVGYNLKSTGTFSANVSSDVSQTIANVKSFIESYNSQLSKINAEIDETKYKDYLPLTSDQRTEMKESEITVWETKAKSGMLHNDSILQDLVTKMRSDVSTPVSGLTGTYTSAASIGITTGTYLEKGKLYLDEAKLTKALEADPEIVNKIFGTTNTDNTHSKNGIAVRLYETIKASSDKIVTEAGATATTTSDIKSSLAKQILNYTQNMKDLNTRLTTLESNYYKKFNAMETALAKLNKQSSWLSSMSTSSSS